MSLQKHPDIFKGNIELTAQNGFFVKSENPTAQEEANELYYEGLIRSDGCGFPQDHAKAAEYFAQAAALGHRDAQAQLGVMFLTGDGVPQDYQKAAFCFAAAANQGDAISQYNLACMYEDGDGVPQDRQKAIQLYTLAARQGMIEAKQALDELMASQ